MASALAAASDRGGESGVLVGDDQAHTAQVAVLQRPQEASPEHLVLAVTDVDTEHFALAGGGDPGRDDRFRDDLVVVS